MGFPVRQAARSRLQGMHRYPELTRDCSTFPRFRRRGIAVAAGPRRRRQEKRAHALRRKPLIPLPKTACKYGRSDRIRTYDPLIPNQMRYQAALRSGTGDSIPTRHPRSNGACRRRKWRARRRPVPRFRRDRIWLDLRRRADIIRTPQRSDPAIRAWHCCAHPDQVPLSQLWRATPACDAGGRTLPEPSPRHRCLRVGGRWAAGPAETIRTAVRRPQ